MDSIIQYLKEDMLPEEKIEADKIRRNATSYWLSKDHKLYKRSFSGPYLLCVHPEQTESLLEEMHEGICGSHTGGRSLAHRVITQGYWWPNMQKEALEYVKKCDQCQRFALSIHQPGGILNPLLAICLVGFRYRGTISQSSGKQEISAGWHRLFYEVG